MTGEANKFPAIISFSPSRHRNRDHNDKHGDMCQYGVRKSHYAVIKGRVNLFKDNLNMTSDFIHWFVDIFLFGLDYYYFFFVFPCSIHRRRKSFIHVIPTGPLTPNERINSLFARLIESELLKASPTPQPNDRNYECHKKYLYKYVYLISLWHSEPLIYAT